MNSESDTKRKRKRSRDSSDDSDSLSDSSRSNRKSRKKEKRSHHRSRSKDRSKRDHSKSKSKSHHHHRHDKDKKKKDKDKSKDKDKDKEKSHKKDKGDKKQSSSHSSKSGSRSKSKKSEKSSSNEQQQVNAIMQNLCCPVGQVGQKGGYYFPPLKGAQPAIPQMIPSMMGEFMPQQMNPLPQEGPADKIVKDQNFLNSDERLFESIINHEMSMKTLFSDCQFSENYLGTVLFRTIKKAIFDPTVSIFDEKDSHKESIGDSLLESQVVQAKIDTLKLNYQRINFGDLSELEEKIFQMKKLHFADFS